MLKEGPFPGLQTATFLLGPPVVESELWSLLSLIRALIPSRERHLKKKKKEKIKVSPPYPPLLLQTEETTFDWSAHPFPLPVRIALAQRKTLVTI